MTDEAPHSAATLFDDRFDDHPSQGDPVVRTWRDASHVLVDAFLDAIDRDVQLRAEVRYYRAPLHRQRQRLDVAEAEIREAVLLRPAAPIYWYVLVEPLLDMGRAPDALDAVTAALRTVPANAQLLALAQRVDAS